ncbi:Gfo/Idh/MocA family protein [Salipiger marinus]|jgi:predicted dehydrogenase|uniref:D-galactose 1-dehydrogenase n=1 Tax=Salipiger marinus TaxID=555512 RepID=A0A1G8PDP8_9RHOB|nr:MULTISPECIES: Gfo/Idh/MocA family oxidoreductase [Salipiger]HBM61575.1 gfo/Idh/MocA family oxidoreductase [Citreicella sp.]MCD1618896.1 Gfo/Idh/MocA family oxidoreductase [Salipiger manganoxidans]MEB3419806.1 Gfo/Idh/MocA family oxidoreductase [Salipiger manganoxidans]SDI90572.1 D-galactose 1-dehydrogenase [Salipiger marinus]HBS99426.1 gfo/Idh/MocA family oxidoreductase [Citreicella sp.]
MTHAIPLGLVGLGTIARNQHLPSLEDVPAFRLAAIASRNASLDGLPGYADIDAMLAAEPDLGAVSLCTPPQGRFAQAAAALRAGKHVMLEKPPGASVSEVMALDRLAQAQGVTLFATWHSREAAAVEEARALLAGATIRRVRIDWKEDVRHWHPGQQWIWQAGGLGVFDPGINALSILTRILPDPVFPLSALLEVPENCQAPIAARLSLQTSRGAPVEAEFDWRQTGPQTWDIHVETDGPEVLLREGGAKLFVDGAARISAEDREYRRLYARFAELIAAGQRDVDLAPLQLVADAFLLGERQMTEPFHD